MPAEGEGGRPAISGVLETALYVDDLPRAASFYEDILGLKRIFVDDRLAAFEAGPASVLLLFRRGSTLDAVTMPGGIIPPHDGHGPLHIALAIPAEALAQWEERLSERGVALESRASWPKGVTSLYFRDPDNHLVELATPGLWPNY